MSTFDPDALLADTRAQHKRAREIGDRARARLGVEPTIDGLTAEQMERDAASIHKILGIWRRIGKPSPSPITLPSGRTITPKHSGGMARVEHSVPRPHRLRGLRP